jgi:asparagine synthase (glutamine-hydrolysing)
MVRAGEVLATEDPASLYLQVISHLQSPSDLVLGGTDPVATTGAPRDLDRFTRWMTERDLVDYLPGDILTKVDRATMAVSLEARVPLLDHRVVEFALGLPTSQKIRGEDGKWVLRQVLDRHVPRAIVDRPKMGFGVPLGSWLRGPLVAWADELLDPHRLRSEGFFDAAAVSRYWLEHREGTRDWQYVLWDVLMFESWLESMTEMRRVR